MSKEATKSQRMVFESRERLDDQGAMRGKPNCPVSTRNDDHHSKPVGRNRPQNCGKESRTDSERAHCQSRHSKVLPSSFTRDVRSEEFRKTKRRFPGRVAAVSVVKAKHLKKATWNNSDSTDSDATDECDIFEDMHVIHEDVRRAIIRAVENGSVLMQEVYNTNLTPGSIRDFFERHQECLESQACGVTHASRQPLDILQGAFVQARSHLRRRAIDQDVLQRKARQAEEMKKAFMMYKQQSSSGKGPKEIMRYICEALNNDSMADSKASAATPAPASEPLRHTTSSQSIGKVRQEPQVAVERQHRSLERKSKPMSPPSLESSSKGNLEAGEDQQLSSQDETRRELLFDASPPSRLLTPRGRLSAARIKRRRRGNGSSSDLESERTNLSEELERSKNPTDSEHESPISPEKKQKGARGRAVPIRRSQWVIR